MRALTMFFALGVIVAVLFGGMAATYALSGLAEAHLFYGAGRLVNALLMMLVFVMVIATLLTLAERKWSALMQDRVGPNRARINLPILRNRSLGGIPHVAADALKMLFKEDFAPRHANKILFNLGPILSFAPVFALFAVVPTGPSIQLFGKTVDMVVASPDFGLLYVFATASLAVYGTALAGWSSNNKFALLGGVRAASQMISYEVALGLSLVGIMLAYSSVQLAGPVGIAAQQSEYLWRFTAPGSFDVGIPRWGFLLQPFGFVLFFVAAFAETKRAPFDVPEGESEIIGYFVEYSGMKFGMFMISEFVEIVVLSGVLAAVFFGAHTLPVGGEWLASQAVFRDNPWLWGALGGTVFWLKVLVLCWLQLTIRWSFPRFRYDQIQSLGWKMLLPLGLVNVFISGALILVDPSLRTLALVGLVEFVAIVGLTLAGRRKASSGDEIVSHQAVAGHH